MIDRPAARLNAVLDALGSHIAGVRYEVPAGTLLLHQDASVTAVYLIEHGIVKLTRCEPDGDHTGVGLRYAGWLLGAAAVVLDLPATTEARTLTPGTLRIIPAAVVIQKLRTDLHFAWLITEMLSREVNEQTSQMAALGALSTRERLLRLLSELTLATPTPPAADRWTKIPLPFRYRDLAQVLQCSPERLSRIISRLQDDGVLRRDSGSLFVRAPVGTTVAAALDQRQRTR